ncbi:MAG: hypothetical protein WKF62_07440 [Solirubrobacterales bacterium]
MDAPRFHLVQLNIARSKGPMDSAFMDGFNALLDPAFSFKRRVPAPAAERPAAA